MDTVAKEKKNPKRGLITKTWERCKSFGRGSSNPPSETGRQLTKKSKSWHSPSRAVEYQGQSSDEGDGKIHRNSKHKHRVAPEGCFSVYVGPHRQRFVVRTEYANHPLFRMLLEEAETEYGYCSAGPLELPCDVEVFRRVLVEMDSDDGVGGPRRRCGFSHGGSGVSAHGAYRLLSPTRMMAINQF